MEGMMRNHISAEPAFSVLRTSTALLLFSLLLGLPIRAAAAVEIEWATVARPTNAADTEVMVCCGNYVGTSGYGAVPYYFRISRYETTNAQYAEFLNAVAATDTHALYNTNMGDSNSPNRGGITRSGHSGSFTYSAIAGRENMPVNHVGFYDAARFANWLHNAQPTGAQDNTTTEDGAYTITVEGIANDTIVRNPGATVFIPSEDEWYKAAYFSRWLNRYYDYPSSRDEQMICEGPGGGTTRNTAACGHPLTDYTDVGSFTRSSSPNSTYDQGGNIWEWNENNAVCGVGCRGLRGGDFGSDPGSLAAANADYGPVTSESHQWGFRVAGLPDPIPPAFEASFILHTFGNDQVDGTGFPFDQKTFIARPLAARCNPSNGGVPCGTETLQEGAPVVGSGTALLDTRESPPRFELPRSALKGAATGSLPQFSPHNYVSTYASSLFNTDHSSDLGHRYDYFYNTFSFPVYSGTKARVAINPGANRFGGTLKILGAMGAKRAHEYQNKTFVGTGRSFFGALGPPCSITCYVIGAAVYTGSQQYETSMGDATTPEVIFVGFPWTTGTASVTATAGSFPTRFRRSGYDNRTANGLGMIQMVAPQIVKWDFANRGEPWDRYTGAIGILRLKFVPEPSGWVMVIAGAAFLSIEYKRRRIG
jgi:formylglycine-generating enzyme required for sulfatase activity